MVRGMSEVSPKQYLALAKQLECGGLPELSQHLTAFQSNDVAAGSVAASMRAKLLHQKGDYEDAKQAFEFVRATVEVESVCAEFHSYLFPQRALSDYSPEAHAKYPDGTDYTRIESFALSLLAEYESTSIEEAARSIEVASAQYESKWKEIVPDEDSVTPAQLGEFYSSLSIATGGLPVEFAQVSMATYIRAQALRVAQSLNATSLYDFGGGIGVVPSAAASVGLSQPVLIEESQKLTDFGVWRNERLGIKGVTLCSPQKATELAGSFDYGVCTEVLEHVWDVEGTVQLLYDLLKPGGILFMTASFGLYPFASHLKKNVVYAGHESELMQKFGFQSVNATGLPSIIPLPLYRKPTD